MPPMNKLRQLSQLLKSDPFNASRASKSEFKIFPRPKLISFDLFDTLYSPINPISESYFRISREFGINKSETSIRCDFPTIFKALDQQNPNFGKGILSSDEEWWLELIIRLYDLPKQESSTKALCAKIIDYFQGSAYHLYDDVIPALVSLDKQNFSLVVASNSDSKVPGILSHLGIAHYFSDVFLSYGLGTRKPAKAFFDTIANSNEPESLEKCWHVGDNYEVDFVGAVRAGWNAVLIDRERKHPIFRGNLQQRGPIILSDNRVVVSLLQEIPILFNI